MKGLSSVLLVLLISSVFSSVLSAQWLKVDPRPGRISEKEMSMTVYEPDTSAVAVVLSDDVSVSMTFSSSGSCRKETARRIRIKILKEDGVDYGDMSVTYWVDGSTREHVTGLDVMSYNLEDGQVVKSRMPKDYVFDEALDGKYRRVKFSAVNVRAGTVIEVEYKVQSPEYWAVDDFYLQRRAPVNQVTYTVSIPDIFVFSKRVRGYEQVSFSESVETKTFSVDGQSYPYGVIRHEYRAYDLPAVKDEPYTYDMDQYMSAVSYRISSLQIPGQVFQNFSITWADVDRILWEGTFSSVCRASCPFKDEVSAAVAAAGDDAQKIAAVCSLVRSKVAWNGKYSLYPDAVGKVLKEMSSSNAGINAVLISALNSAGYTAEPVLLRPRSRGVLLDMYPELSAFVTFVVRVESPDGYVCIVDGSSGNSYLDILPDDFLVTSARILRKDGGEWIDISHMSRNTAFYSADMQISEDGVKGVLKGRFSGQNSYDFKSDYSSYDSEDDFISGLENDCSIRVDDASFEGVEDYSGMAGMTLGFSADAGVMGDRIYFCPFLFKFHKASSFSEPERRYPVDFPYCENISYMARVVLPDGYSVESLPENSVLKLDDISASAMLLASYDGMKTVTLRFQFALGSMTGTVEQYAFIKDFWEKLSAMYDTRIVLRKDN